MQGYCTLTKGKHIELSGRIGRWLSASTKTGNAECHCGPPSTKKANGEQATDGVSVYNYLIVGPVYP